MPTLLTWNVLHRIHGQKWSEPAVTRWPDEAARTDRIVGFLRATDATWMCLQEVSGDTLAALRASFPDRAVLNHPHPRIPALREGRSPLSDPSEHLVILGPLGTRIHRSERTSDDPGKGWLVARGPDGTWVTSTHQGVKQRGAEHRAALKRALASLPGAVLVGGDFNARAADVERAFEPDLVRVGVREGAPPTREGTPGETIDHVLTRGVVSAPADVLEADALSDHRPIVVRWEHAHGPPADRM